MYMSMYLHFSRRAGLMRSGERDPPSWVGEWEDGDGGDGGTALQQQASA